jgi:hypothetical protein
MSPVSYCVKICFRRRSDEILWMAEGVALKPLRVTIYLTWEDKRDEQ